METRTTAITHQIIKIFAADDGSLNLAAAEKQVADLARRYRFFHWHVEFPYIFLNSNGGPGTSTRRRACRGRLPCCVIGNPPWERVKLPGAGVLRRKGPPAIANAA